MKEENPWNIYSIYDLQYFNCPSCPYKNNIKQEFVNHAFDFHPEAEEYLRSINDGSLDDVEIPFGIKYDVKPEPEPETTCTLPSNELEIKLEEGIEDEEDYHNSLQDDEDWVEEDIKEDLSDDKDLNSLQDDKYWMDDIKDASEGTSSQSHSDNKCESCGKSFTRSHDLKRHINMVHNKCRDYKCESCGKAFAEAGNLKRHINTVHDGNKDFKCESCEKAFTKALYLHIHIRRIHEGHKDFECESCGKSFSQPQNLKRHVHTVHEGHKDHKCEFCGKSFSRAEPLKIHIHNIHQ